jgi:uncharacterized membrane protein
MSILTLPVAPRARFFQNLVVTMLLTCFAIAISYLSMWCAVRARANTTHIQEGKSGGPVAGTAVSPFNAAASVNMAVWLFFEAWLANMFRAFRPQYFVPSIVFSIFIQVTGTYGTQFATMDEASSLVSSKTLDRNILYRLWIISRGQCVDTSIHISNFGRCTLEK